MQAATFLARAGARQFSTSAIARSEAPVVVRASKRPVGGFRGGIVGFLVGVTAAGGAGYYYLLEEYQTASSLLLSSVEELQTSTNKVRDYVKKIESVEAELKTLKEKAATKQELKDLQKDTKKLYDSLDASQLELKTHIFGLEKSLFDGRSDKSV